MTKDVLVSISGLQFVDDEGTEPIEIITSGEYYSRNGKHYVVFDEVMEGFQGVTKNRIKIYENYLDIQKKGVSNVHMIFERNKKNVGYYETPYGSLLIGIQANRIDMEETADDIHVRVDYALDVNEEPLADCKISINIKSKETGDFQLHS